MSRSMLNRLRHRDAETILMRIPLRMLPFIVVVLLGGMAGGLAGCGSPADEVDKAVGASSTVDRSFVDDPFLADVQERTFRWFWDLTNPATGLTPDREPSHTFSSIAAVGFGLTAYGIGAERGYVTREEAASRTLNTLKFFWELPVGPQEAEVAGYKGFYYHFLTFEDGHRFNKTQLSTIDTALLMAGVLFAQGYFDGSTDEEQDIRSYADSLFNRVEWNWFAQDETNSIVMAWKPEQQFGPHAYHGYDEAMILYLLALGSSTYPTEPDVWDGFTSTYVWDEYMGQEYLQFGPHFGHQYSHLWVDFRGIQDAYMKTKGIDYFENSRRATLAQREYARRNPRGFVGYSEDMWGLTASDGPARVDKVIRGDSVKFFRYTARGVSTRRVTDDGTLVPTAAGGSIPFAPEISINALKMMKETYGDLVYNQYGFVDAFNPTFTFVDASLEFGTIDPEKGWFDTDQLGIDQGPIVAMIENYRSELVWDVMKRSPVIVRGLCRAGFTGGWLDGRCDNP